MKRVTEASAVAREAKPLVQALLPGQSVTILLPESTFWRREGYRSVSGLANRLLGVGTYSLDGRSIPGSVIVTLLLQPRKRLSMAIDDRRARREQFLAAEQSP